MKVFLRNVFWVPVVMAAVPLLAGMPREIRVPLNLIPKNDCLIGLRLDFPVRELKMGDGVMTVLAQEGETVYGKSPLGMAVRLQ